MAKGTLWSKVGHGYLQVKGGKWVPKGPKLEKGNKRFKVGKKYPQVQGWQRYQKVQGWKSVPKCPRLVEVYKKNSKDCKEYIKVKVVQRVP